MLAAAGCTRDEFVHRAGVPGASTPASIRFLAERHGYLDIDLATGGREFRFFLPPTEACRALSTGDVAARYRNSGPLGQIIEQDGERMCEPVGIMSLLAWRNSRPRGRRRDVVPRGQAQFREVYRDEDLILLMGRFPLASHIGWSGGERTLAAIDTSENCQQVAERNIASIEFRDTGRRPFMLLARRGGCDVIGFARDLTLEPLPDESEETAPEADATRDASAGMAAEEGSTPAGSAGAP